MVSQAIYLHSSWRAASTYVWSKFRQRPEFYGYFEPLNEHMAKAPVAFIDGFKPWPHAHHPKLDAPYLAEFRPLIAPGGGIPGFPAHLTAGQFCAGPADALPELDAYLTHLEALASQQGRRPVYGFVRTALRVGWFRARAPKAPHIFIRRDPRRQFLSMLKQNVHGDSYFLQRGLVILFYNRDQPLFAPLCEAVGFPNLLAKDDIREIVLGKPASESALPTLYFIFYYFQLLARRLSEPLCDLVIDIDRLSLDAAYREVIEARTLALTGVAIRFDDAQVERYEENIEWSAPFFEALERDVAAYEASLWGDNAPVRQAGGQD